MKLKAPYVASANVDGRLRTRAGKVIGVGKQRKN
jgi:hypothetical protein